MKHSIKKKEKILKKIRQLATQHHISLEEVYSALASSPLPPPVSKVEILMKWCTHLGGLFIFSGLIIYIGTFWSSMGSILKTSLTLGMGAVLYGLTLCLTLEQKIHKSYFFYLIFIAISLQTGGLFVAANEFNQGIDLKIPTPLIFGIMLIQQWLSFKKSQYPCFIFMAIVFWSLFLPNFFDLFNVSEKMTHIIMGISLLHLSYLLGKKHYSTIANFWYFIGSILFLNGFFELVKKTYFEFTVPLMSAAIIYLSIRLKNKILLLVSTVSLLGYFSYFMTKYLMHSAAWPILLVLLGVVCTGIGFMALKICKKHMQN